MEEEMQMVTRRRYKQREQVNVMGGRYWSEKMKERRRESIQK